MKRANLIFILSFLLGVAGCHQASVRLPSDDSILSQKPCQFPCWRGLTPGVSTTADVQQLIASDMFIKQARVARTGEDGLHRTVYQWWYDAPSHSNRIIVANDVIEIIEIYPNSSFTLQEVITLYGEPTGMNAQLSTYLEGGMVDAILSLYYAHLGLVVEFKIEGGSVITVKQFYVKPETRGTGFSLYRPQPSFEDLIAEIYRISGDELKNFVESSTLGWAGFNSVLVVNPDRRAYYDETFILTATPNSLTP